MFTKFFIPKFIINDRTKYFTKPIYNSVEIVTKRPLRQAAKKVRLALKTCI